MYLKLLLILSMCLGGQNLFAKTLSERQKELRTLGYTYSGWMDEGKIHIRDSEIEYPRKSDADIKGMYNYAIRLEEKCQKRSYASEHPQKCGNE